MKTIEYHIRSLCIPMKVNFKHASAERKVSASLWVEARRGELVGLGEGCPRDYVTGETLESALLWAEATAQKISSRIDSLQDLRRFVAENSTDIDQNPSAWCALELAILDLLAKEKDISIEKLLGVSESKSRFQYTAVLSADDPQKFKQNIKKYLRFGFADFKLKVVADEVEDQTRISELKQHVSPGLKLLWPPVRLMASTWAHRSPFNFRLRLDGNNAWAGREDAIYGFLRRCALRPWAIEEPFAPHDYRLLSELSRRENIAIILDESLCHAADIERAAKFTATWVANLRVSKLGGLLRSLEIVKILRRERWQIIVGAQVGETSVLSRAALVIARAAGALLTAQEGAFGSILLEKDMTSPEIKFGLAGIVLNPAGRDQGLGLKQD